ncbi:MAG: hypothetical protein ACRD2C_21110 [Acidimicrobiales bacterium]
MVAIATAVGLIVATATPAPALTAHTTTVLDGSSIAIQGGATFELGIGTPQCSDGVDNDEDGDIDAAADAECDAGGAGQPASDDDSECEAGFQAQGAAPTFTFDDDGINDGTDNLSNFAITFPPAEVCAEAPIIGTVCFLVGISADETGATGDVVDVVPNTSAEIVDVGGFDFTVAVAACDHDAPPGFNPTNCRVTFPDATFSTLNSGGVTYTEAGGVGQATLVSNIPSGPAFANGSCGSFIGTDYAAELNMRLGLPNAVVVTLVGETVPDLSSV